MQVVIDRFEENMAVVELADGSMAHLPRVLVPAAREGDIVNIEIDADAREKRESAVEELMNELFSD